MMTAFAILTLVSAAAPLAVLHGFLEFSEDQTPDFLSVVIIVGMAAHLGFSLCLAGLALQ